MTYTIEVVCAGNIARSPIAEAVGNAYVRQQGLSSQLKIVSSGAMVNNPLDFPRAKRFIELSTALPDRTPLPEDSLPLLTEILYSGDAEAERYTTDATYRASVDALTAHCRQDLRRVGREMRDLVLGEISLRSRTDQVQTVVRSDVALVLGLDSKVTSAAQRIYREGGRDSVPVVSLGDYTSTAPDIEDPVGIAVPEPYRVLRDALAEGMRLAVDRFAGEKSLRGV